SAAAASSSVASSGSVTPVRSMALRSMWEASQGAISATRPVRTLTTPPGTSEVASTSASVIAGSGACSAATTTQVLPVTITGATADTRPRSDEAGATTATTPLGSGTEKSKYGPATGLDEPCTWCSLSLHPAYQTQRSTAASTTRSAARGASPSASATSATNCARRPSSTSATR